MFLFVISADSRNSGGIIAAIVVVVTIILIVVGLVIFKRRNQKQEIELPSEFFFGSTFDLFSSSDLNIGFK